MNDRVFLSHKGANKDIVLPYYKALSAAGFHPWLDDEDMPAGTNPDRGILQGFKDSCAVIFFLTKEFEDERFLADEINYAKTQEREKGGDRFAIITVIVPDSFDEEKPVVPDLLQQYVWVEKKDHLSTFAKIVTSLPLRPGKTSWKIDFDAYEFNLTNLRGEITIPQSGQTMPPGFCHVAGKVEGYNQQHLFLFTGDVDRFWPSMKISPDPEGYWTGRVHLGQRMPTGTIRFVAVDPNLSQYIDIYRRQASQLNYCGMVIPKFPHPLHKITVNVDLSSTTGS